MAFEAAMAVVAVAGTAFSYAGQQQQAKAQNAANQGYATAESAAAAANAVSQYGQGQRQIEYQDTQASQKTQAENMQAAAAKGTAATNASARGVTGNSVDAIQRDYTNRRDMFDADVAWNQKASDDEIVQQMKGIQLGNQSQDNQIQSSDRFVQGPSTLGLVGGIAADTANAYSMYIKPQPITPTAPTSGPSSSDYAALDNVESGIY